MAKTTFVKKSTRSPATGSKNPSHETLTAVTVEAQASPLNSASEKNAISQSTQHENCAKKAQATTKAPKPAMKAAAKTS